MYFRQYVYSPTSVLFKCDFSYSFAAIDRISTDINASRGPSAVTKFLVESPSIMVV